MDVFVVLVHLRQSSLVAPTEYQSEDIGGQETSEREKPVINDFHGCKGNAFSAKCLEISEIVRIFAAF
jgi:hypothetical protein